MSEEHPWARLSAATAVIGLATQTDIFSRQTGPARSTLANSNPSSPGNPSVQPTKTAVSTPRALLAFTLDGSVGTGAPSTIGAYDVAGVALPNSIVFDVGGLTPNVTYDIGCCYSHFSAVLALAHTAFGGDVAHFVLTANGVAVFDLPVNDGRNVPVSRALPPGTTQVGLESSLSGGGPGYAVWGNAMVSGR